MTPSAVVSREALNAGRRLTAVLSVLLFASLVSVVYSLWPSNALPPLDRYLHLGLFAAISLALVLAVRLQSPRKESQPDARAVALGVKEMEIKDEMRLLFDMLPAFVWSASPDGQFEYLNQQIQIFTGKTLKELQDDPTSVLHPDDLAARERDWHRMLHAGEPMEREIRYRGADGVYHWFQTRSRPLRDDAGRVLRWYFVTWNIDRHKGAETALRENERSLLELLERLPCQIATAEPDGRHSYANRRMLDYCGMTLEEAKDSGWLGIIHPDDRPAVANEWIRCGKAREPMDVNHRLRRRDGVYRWFNARVEPFFDDRGQVVRWYGVITDIDDRLRAEVALRDNERQLRTIIDTMPGLVWFCDSNGHNIYISKQLLEYSGISLQQGAQLAWRTCIHPDDADRADELWENARLTGQSFSGIHRIRGADGAYRWFQVQAEPVLDDNGVVRNWCGINFNIDRARRMEETLTTVRERLVHASKLATVSELSASIAHEINQPLSAVVSNGDACIRWLCATPPNIERAQISAGKIVRDAKSAGAVVQRIRALFKHAASDRAFLDVNDVIREVLKLMEPEIIMKGIHISADLDLEIPHVFADRVHVQQVLINLVQNGIDAMDEIRDRPKALLLRSQIRESNFVTIQVKDSGIGIADAGAIFEPFYTTKENGLGVGLSICRSIIEAHEGRLCATADAGGGSTFEFTLPVQAAMPQ